MRSKRPVNRTTHWAKVCKNVWGEGTGPEEGRNLFGIVQGGRFKELRRKSAEELIEIGFPGYAVGGVSVGETGGNARTGKLDYGGTPGG